jgi:Zn-dependent protease
LFEYLGLFLIVLMHEFGHALACRQVGGRADRIILWPLGGIAFVDPPFRPGAYLWSIAAGPLVNVFLFPVLGFLLFAAVGAQWHLTNPDLYRFIDSLVYINAMLLIFNLLPVYPLDGGQIVRALLWFKLGPIRSLKIASVIGFIGAIAFGIFAFQQGSIWFGLLAFFIFSQARIGWMQAQNLAAAGATPPPIPPAVPVRE